MTTTRYFTEQILRKRPYLSVALCRSVLVNPLRRIVQDDGRIRHWGRIILPNKTETRNITRRYVGRRPDAA